LHVPRLFSLVHLPSIFPLLTPFPQAEAFMQIDRDYLAAISSSAAAAEDSAGTTALAAVVWGSTLYVANAGDSRAVLSRHGKAIELTRDHKPHEPSERQRIELCGGYVCSEGRLCGELAVARAIGDFHLPQLKGGQGSSAGEQEMLMASSSTASRKGSSTGSSTSKLEMHLPQLKGGQGSSTGERAMHLVGSNCNSCCCLW
jgi:hypothetical protein